MKRLLLFFLLITASATAQQAELKLPKGYRLPTHSKTLQEGFYLVVKGEGEDTRYGYADREGKIIIKAQYPYAFPFRNGYAIVAEGPMGGDLKGLIDTTGRLVTPIRWHRMGSVIDGRFVVGEENDLGKRNYYFLNTQGEKLFDRAFDYADDFSEGVAVVGVGSWSRPAIPNNVNLPEGFTLNIQDIVAEFKGLYGLIDTLGREIIAPKYLEIKKMHNGLAIAAIEGKYYPKYGYLNRNGETVIPFDYYQAEKFNDGLAVVCKVVQGELKYGYIDLTGREAIPIRWDYASAHEFGRLWVGLNEGEAMRYMLLDSQGRELLSQWVYALNPSGRYGHASCAIPDGTGELRYGVISSRGKVIIPFEYDQITLFTEWDNLSQSYIERGIAYRDNLSIPFSLSR